MFTDNMVLQQQCVAPIWGQAKAGKKIKVTTSWNGKSYVAQTDRNGNWRVDVLTDTAGGPYEITISDGDKTVLHNVLLGEVWLCSGQSNMEMPMQGWDIKMNAEEIANSGNFQNIRLLQVDEVMSTQPKRDIKVRNQGWMTCSPETVKDFSATGFFFGKNININAHVPVGLIMSCWGGTPIESWISRDELANVPTCATAVHQMEALKMTDEQRVEKYRSDLRTWLSKEMRSEGGASPTAPVPFAQSNYNDANWSTVTVPGLLSGNGLDNYDGAIWFRKTVDIPASWAGKTLNLNVGMVDDNDVTFFNGVEIGRTEGYNVQRHYTIPARLVKSGKAVITVYDLDTGGGGGIYGKLTDLSLSLSGTTEKISLAGTWQYNASKELSKMTDMPVNSYNSSSPTVLFNSMINPLVPYRIKGAIWYQGEANVGHAAEYAELLPMLVNDWRSKWGHKFPFYIMQLANYQARHEQPGRSEWAELREAQMYGANHIDSCDIAVNIDLGLRNNIHPLTKPEVGRRLALLALAHDYNKQVAYSGPRFISYRIEEGQIRLSFRFADGLKSADGTALKGFAVAGPDHKYHWAEAKIDNGTVVVSSAEVRTPVAVRYAWDDDPVGNLTNSTGLPAFPFRTDSWDK